MKFFLNSNFKSYIVQVRVNSTPVQGGAVDIVTFFENSFLYSAIQNVASS